MGRISTRSPNNCRRRRGRQRCGGAIILEMVLALPILLLLLLVTIQFGAYFINMQQLALACRVGAEEASETATAVLAATSDGDPVPQSILDRTFQQLQTAGIQPCTIKLEHNVGGSPVVLVSPGDGCPCEPFETLPCTLSGNYVRLTICVPMAELMPDCMPLFGDLQNRVTQCTTIFRHELSAETPSGT